MNKSNVFRRKTADVSSTQSGPQLKRVLSVFDLTMNGVAAIIGAGIFVLVGTVASAHAGAGIWISFVLSGLACACVAFSYAELAGMIPSAGSVYEYAYRTLGELPAFLMGWTILIAYSIGSSAVAVGLSGYVATMLVPLGIVLPPFLLEAPAPQTAIGLMAGLLLAGAGYLVSVLRRARQGLSWRIVSPGLMAAGAAALAISVASLESVNLVAVVAIAAISFHLWHGVKESVRLTTILSFVEVLLVLAFIGLTVRAINPVNLVAVMPFGPTGILSGAAVIFFAYIGFDSITTMGEECRNPEKDLPRAILWSLGICTVLYILVGIGMTGAVWYAHINPAAPLADVLAKLGYGWLVSIFSVGVLFSIESTLNVLLYAQSRIIMGMSRDGLLPATLGKINSSSRTPHMAILFVGTVSAAIAGLFSIGSLVQLVNIGVLAAFIAVCMGVVILRYTRPEQTRTFRCPLVPGVPLLGAVVSFVMMLSLGVSTWLLFSGSSLAGLLIYVFYGYGNSHLGREKQTKCLPAADRPEL